MRLQTGIFVLAGMLFTQTGCLNKIVLNGTIEKTRQGSAAFGRIGDYELARSAASAGLVQFEGYLELSPGNEDALFLLLKSWVGYGYAFAEDDYEAAVDAGDDDLAEYHKGRARRAYTRAVEAGTQLLEKEDKEGWAAARKNDASMKAWLTKTFTDKEDAGMLFWMGYAWLARTNVMKDDPAAVAELFVGVAFLERSVALDPTYENYGGYAALGSYHARAQMAELDQAKELFEKSINLTQRKVQIAMLAYATRWACQKQDRATYESVLNEIINTEETTPEQRLTNQVAKRRARRYLGKNRMSECGFDANAPAKTAETPKTDAPKTDAAKTDAPKTDTHPADTKPPVVKPGDAKPPITKPPVKPIAPRPAPKAP